jgi:hypothetical protein
MSNDTVPDNAQWERFEGKNAGEYVELSRLEALFSARKAAANAIRESETVRVQLGQNAFLADEAVRAAVVAYCYETEPMLRETAAGAAYWKGVDIGTIPIPRTPPRSRPAKHMWRPNQDSGRITVTDIDVHGVGDAYMETDDDDIPTGINIIGVESFLQIQSPIKVTYHLTGRDQWVRPEDTDSRVRRIDIPRWISEQVFRINNRLIEDLDIKLPIVDDPQGDAGWESEESAIRR